ncbi:MAG: hypothetical protein AAFV53_34035 [Myxococcota bacterium]
MIGPLWAALLACGGSAGPRLLSINGESFRGLDEGFWLEGEPGQVVELQVEYRDRKGASVRALWPGAPLGLKPDTQGVNATWVVRDDFTYQEGGLILQADDDDGTRSSYTPIIYSVSPYIFDTGLFSVR